MSEPRVVYYSEKSVALLGNTKAIKEEIKELGGKPNWYLKCEGITQFGYIFPATKINIANRIVEAYKQGILPVKDGVISYDMLILKLASVIGTINDIAVEVRENLPKIETELDGYVKIFNKEFKKVNLPKQVSSKKHSVENLILYMLSNIPKLKKAIIGEMGIGSIIKNDTNFVPDDGKRYVFLGGGCGFSHIKVDGRNKLSVKIEEDGRAIKKDIEAVMIKTIDKGFLTKLEDSGNPIEAHLFQNLIYKIAYNHLIVNYMLDFGVKKVSMRNFDD